MGRTAARRLGGVELIDKKNREMGGPLALGGRRFKCLNNNQMGDGDNVRGCVGEEARLGRNVWGGRLPVVWGVELIDKKINRWVDLYKLISNICIFEVTARPPL